MANDWKETQIRRHVIHQKGFAFKSRDYTKNGHKIVRVSDFTESSIDISSCNSIDHKNTQQYGAYKLHFKDVVIATVGSWPSNPASVVGRTIKTPLEADGFLLNQNAVILRSEGSLDQDFLFYLLKTPNYQNYIISTARGSANQASITLDAIFGFTFLLPSLDEQRRIAHILGTLDEKIELNRQMNETLEAMAQALFQSWFVDFDPVIDKALASGKEIPEPLQEKAARREALGSQRKSLPPEVESLFPDEFVESELGWIPRGWGSQSLGSILTPKKGKTITKEKCIKGNIPVIAGGLKPAYYHNQHNVSLPAVTISASGANAGYVHLHHQNIWASDCSYIGQEQTSTPYLWYMFLKINQKRIFEMQHGAAQPHIYPADIMRLPTVHPNNQILWKQANQLLTPLFLQIGRNLLDSEILINLRDTLLPKLISGEIRIPEAEGIVEEALNV